MTHHDGMVLDDYSLYPQTTAAAYAVVVIVIEAVVCLVVVFVFVKFLLP